MRRRRIVGEGARGDAGEGMAEDVEDDEGDSEGDDEAERLPPEGDDVQPGET